MILWFTPLRIEKLPGSVWSGSPVPSSVPIARRVSFIVSWLAAARIILSHLLWTT